MLEYQAISSITLKIGLFHLLVTDYFMYYVVIVDWYKYRWLRRDSLRVCNEFPLLSYIFWTQQSNCQSLSARNWVQFHSLIGSQMIKWYVDIHQGQVVNAHSSLNLWNEDFRNSSMIPSKCALTIGSGKTLGSSGKSCMVTEHTNILFMSVIGGHLKWGSSMTVCNQPAYWKTQQNDHIDSRDVTVPHSPIYRLPRPENWWTPNNKYTPAADIVLPPLSIFPAVASTILSRSSLLSVIASGMRTAEGARKRRIFQSTRVNCPNNGQALTIPEYDAI